MIEEKACLWCISPAFENEFVVGSSSGKLFFVKGAPDCHLIQTLHCSQGEILTVARDVPHSLLFFSGNDSNIFAVSRSSLNGKYSVLSKQRGQSHSVHALFCFEWRVPDQSSGQVECISKLLSGGETSDICVMDLSESGFWHRERDSQSSKSAGFRHVLEPVAFLLQAGSSGDSFLRRADDFCEIVSVEADAPPKFTSLFSLDHSMPISCADFCAKSEQIAYFKSEDNKLCIASTATGDKLISIPNVFASQISVSRDFILYFDVLSNSLRFIKKKKKYDFGDIHDFSVNLNCSFVDQIEVDSFGRLVLISDSLSKNLFIVNMQTKQVSDFSAVWKKNHVIKLFRLHPTRSKVFYINNNNSIFYLCLKTNKTAKLNTGKAKIPRNIQIFNLIFSPRDPSLLRLIGDYHLVKLWFGEAKDLQIFKRDNRIINVRQLVDSDGKFKPGLTCRMAPSTSKH